MMNLSCCFSKHILELFRIVHDVPQTQTPTLLETEVSFGIEIFSIYVGGINCEVSGLCGTIDVYGSLDPTSINKRDLEDPELLADDKFTCIKGNSAFMNPEFWVVLNMKDPIEKLIISNGRISWSTENLCDADCHGIINAFVLLFEVIMAMQVSIT